MAVRIFLSGTVVVVLAAIVAGILFSGRPDQARLERFDWQRYSDLTGIGHIMLCQKDADEKPPLPAELTLESMQTFCGGLTVQPGILTDSETGEPYRYTRKNDREYSVCADFHDARKLMETQHILTAAGYTFDPETGCLNGQTY
jgi:hypothetical protein